LQFSATVIGDNNPPQTVSWTVTGGGDGTSINSAGVLTVADNETAGSLIVTATSTFDTTKKATANVTLTEGEYTLTYELNGGTNNDKNSKTYTTAKLVTLHPATRAGHSFGGWYDNADFDGDAVTKIPAGSRGNKTFYAQWTAGYTVTPPTQYTLTYELNDGTNGENPATYTAATPVITLAPATRAGYGFGGWYDNAEFDGEAVTTIPTGSTGNKTFYANWTIVTYTH
jgi:uncharacterized repeat protein (TIGR02543 family)